MLSVVWDDDGSSKLLHIIEKIMNRKNISLMAFDEILICFPRLSPTVLYSWSAQLKLEIISLLQFPGNLIMYSVALIRNKNTMSNVIWSLIVNSPEISHMCEASLEIFSAQLFLLESLSR